MTDRERDEFHRLRHEVEQTRLTLLAEAAKLGLVVETLTRQNLQNQRDKDIRGDDGGPTH